MRRLLNQLTAMHKPSRLLKQLWKNPQHRLYVVASGGILALTGILYLTGLGINQTFFQANILGVGGTPAPFDGTVYPIEKTINWVKMSSTQFADFRSGKLTYTDAEQAGILMNIPEYNKERLRQDPAQLKWSGDDLETRKNLLTYVTAYMGMYTGGSKPAIENTGSHLAVDIRAPKGTPIRAIANGKVVKVKLNASDGNTVVIEHPNVPSLENPAQKTTYYSSYLHLDTAGVQLGDIVTKGQQIGTVGNTGIATTYHLHLQLDKEEAPFHPYWPFTWAEVSANGLDFFSAVNAGLNKDKALLYTVHPMEWIHAHMNSSTPSTPTTNNTTTTSNTNTNTETPVANTNTAPTNINTTTTDSPINTNDTPINTNEVPENTNTETTPPANTNTSLLPELPEETTDASDPVVAAHNATFATQLQLDYPSQVNVGERIPVTIAGRDPEGKPAIVAPSDVVILSAQNGRGTFSKSVLSFSDFSTGSAEVTFVPEQEGSITIAANKGGTAFAGPVLAVQTPEGPVFTDMDSTHPHYKAVAWLKSKGVIEGYADGSFRPDQTINRAEAVKLILSGSSIEPLANFMASAFPDVKMNDWFAGWVMKARDLGIVQGNPDGNFQPGDNVLGAAALKMILLTNRVETEEIRVFSNPYTDVRAGEWYAVFYQYAKEKNLITPDNEGNGHPGRQITRGQIAEIMYRMMKIRESGLNAFTAEL